MKITFIENNGTEHSLDVEPGDSVMEVAIQNNIDGIDAECGGSCMCATCHCFIDETFLNKLPEADETENDLLDCTSESRQSNSRLSCQLELTTEMDGLIVRLPATQS